MKWIYKYHRQVEIFILLAFCAFLLLYRLDALPLRQWDEAKNAVSAIEMMQNKNCIVRYYEGIPDYWGVKPPLLTWLQVLGLKIFGVNEIAVRIPSVLAAFLTMVFLIWYFHKFHHKIHIGYLSALVLATSPGFVGWHVARTGDHDALLVLFTTMITFLYYEFITSDKLNNRLLIACAGSVFLAIMTKGIAIMMIFPGLFVLTFLYKSQKRLFCNRWFYFCLVGLLVLTSGYYLWREQLQPGYLKTVWDEELLPRYLNTNSKFSHVTFLFYGKGFFKDRLSFWIYPLILSFASLPLIYDKHLKKLGVFLFLFALAFFLIISAGTKNAWYDAPLFPVFSSIIALAGWHAAKCLQWKGKPVKNIFILLFFTLIMVYPTLDVYQNIKRDHEYSWDHEIYDISHLLRKWTAENKQDLYPASIVFNGYHSHLLFYTKAYYLKTSHVIPIKTLKQIKKGDYILISQEQVLDEIEALFTCEIINRHNAARLLYIQGKLR